MGEHDCRAVFRPPLGEGPKTAPIAVACSTPFSVASNERSRTLIRRGATRGRKSSAERAADAGFTRQASGSNTGVVPTQTEELANGATVGDGRFVINGVLGRGAQGTTYEAVDKQQGELVALKRFSIRHARNWKDVELAEREAAVLARLTHPSLPRYVAHFEEDGALYLAMEKVEGKTLRALRDTGDFSQQDVVRLLWESAATLDYLHSRSPAVIHRDIKPSNVIRRPDGSFALVDFGSVRHHLNPTDGSTVVGTFGYMAPEQFQGRAMPATDTYALAATALSMLAGSDPDQLPHQGLAIDVEGTLGSRVDERLKRVLTDALDPDPDRRSRQPLSQLLRTQRLDAVAVPSEQPSPRRPSTQARHQAAGDGAGNDSTRDKHRDKHRERRERRQERRRDRRARRGAGPHGLPPLLRGLVLTLLATLRVGVGVLFLLVLPLLLTLLSVALGPKLRRRARQARVAGRQLQQALRTAATRVTIVGEPEAQQPEGASEQTRQRVHIDESPATPRQRVAERPVDFDDVEAQLRDFEDRIDDAVQRISRNVEDISRKR